LDKVGWVGCPEGLCDGTQNLSNRLIKWRLGTCRKRHAESLNRLSYLHIGVHFANPNCYIETMANISMASFPNPFRRSSEIHNPSRIHTEPNTETNSIVVYKRASSISRRMGLEVGTWEISQGVLDGLSLCISEFFFSFVQSNGWNQNCGLVDFMAKGMGLEYKENPMLAV